jgi:DNA-binding transcriptional LysR family regulator
LTVSVPSHSFRARSLAGRPGGAGSSLCKILAWLRYRHLSLLIALDEYRNLHRAAKAVHLTQPTASKVVQDLELLFGSPLFDRVPTGMQPTELGTAVVAFAHHALNDLQRFAADLDHRHAARERRLIVGTTLDLVPQCVVPAMTEIKRRRPALAITLHGATHDELIDLLMDGHTDITVGYFTDTPRHSDIDYEHLGTEALAILARKHHPLSRVPELLSDELEHAAWICHSRTSSARLGMTTLGNVVESNSIATTLNLLLQSDALTLLPESVVRNYLEAGQVVRIPVIVGEIGFGVLSRQGEPMSGPALEFVELLRGETTSALT